MEPGFDFVKKDLERRTGSRSSTFAGWFVRYLKEADSEYAIHLFNRFACTPIKYSDLEVYGYEKKLHANSWIWSNLAYMYEVDDEDLEDLCYGDKMREKKRRLQELKLDRALKILHDMYQFE